MFNFDLKKIIFIAMALCLPILSINMEQKRTDSIWLSKPWDLLSGLAQESFYLFSSGVRETTSLYLNLIDVKKNSLSTKSQNSELMARLEAFNELRLENDRLKELLSFKQSTKMQLIAARIIARDAIPDHNSITINKGTNDGVLPGQAVITTGGVVGFIFKPSPITSHVMLITDRYAVADGIVQRTRAHGIVEGKSHGLCVLQYVERTEDVKPGDIVVTGGLDNIFPKGFPLAIVEKVERKTFSVSLKVDMKPAVDHLKVEEVFVIKDAAKEDFAERFVPSTPTPSSIIHQSSTSDQGVKQ